MLSIITRTTVIVAAAAILTGCAQAERNCTIYGRVRYTGDPPKRTKINLKADPTCAGMYSAGVSIGTENVVVNKDSETLQNVVVSVKGGLSDQEFHPPAKPVLIDQNGCHYNPHVVALMKGQKLVVRNSDDTLHNIHGLSEKNPVFNFAQPKKGMEKELGFEHVETFPVMCDVHPWMGAHIAVFPHPFFDVTDQARGGAFELTGLPAGEYTIEAWHEEYGTMEQKVTVADGETKEIEFTYEIK